MFFFSSRRRHTRFSRDWSSDVCSSDLTSVSWQFFLFCQETLVEEGFFLHKYTPYGQPGSSWLPWVDSHGGRTLPRSEERRVGKSVDLGGRRSIKKKMSRSYVDPSTEQE